MRTFTFRVSHTLADRMTSALMRAWIGEFLRSPYSLPPDPGTGDHRISLTLPADQVEQLAGMLGCTSSSALRRLALAKLGFVSKIVPSPSAAVAPATDRRVTTSSLEELVEKQRRIAALQNHPRAPMTEKKSGSWGFLFAGAIAFLVFLFFGFGPGNSPE